MAVVTIDAKAELAQLQAAQDAEAAAEKPVAAAAQKPAESPAPAAKPSEEDPDDIEGEDGLTPREKRDLSAKMQKAVGKRIAQRKDAEDFAAVQYAERQLAEERAAALERENAELKARVQPAVSRETQPDPEAGKPIRDKFDSDQAYWDAYVDWRAERKAAAKIAEQRAEDAKLAAQAQRAELVKVAEARVAKALELVPDFQQKVLDRGNDILIPTAIIEHLERSELMPETVYYLAQNPDIVEKLAKMPPDEQLVTIGKIEGTLKPFEPQGSKAATTDGAKPSEAANGRQPAAAVEPSETGSIPSRARSSAPVITPLNGNSGAAVQPDPRDMDIRETIFDWSKRNKVNLGLRKRH